MATRTVLGLFYRPNGSPYAFADVRFTLLENTFTLAPDASYPRDTIIATTDSEGRISVELATDLSSRYKVETPDGQSFEIIVEAGGATTLEFLRAATEGITLALTNLESIIASYLTAYTGLGINVKEAGVSKVTTLASLDFVSGATVTESPTGEANVTITTHNPVTVVDTATINLTLTDQQLSADLIGALHDPVTVVDSATIDFTLTGQQITASRIVSITPTRTITSGAAATVNAGSNNTATVTCGAGTQRISCVCASNDTHISLTTLDYTGTTPGGCTCTGFNSDSSSHTITAKALCETVPF